LSELGWEVDHVVPIPLGDGRKAERGYNQVALIGIPLALSLGFRYLPDGLRRIRDTRSQVGLESAERLENVRGAFLARRELVQNQALLLLDDVTTTGATLEAAAEALLNGGARQVYALTLARTVLSLNPPSGSADLNLQRDRV
jgi:ComF family protein